MDPIYTSSYWYYTYFPIIFGAPQSPMTQLVTPPPIYGFYYNPEGIERAGILSRLSSLVANVQESTREFLGSENVFNERTLNISTEAVTGEVESGAPIATYEISVSQLATNQVNTGNWLNSSALDFSSGVQTFRITIGSQEHEFSVEVTSEDTNLSVLDKMAEAINEAGIGVSARVETSDGQARLVLESTRTGESSAFTVSDVSGNLVSVSGVSNTTQNAQNMVYTVNGMTSESETNTIELQGVKLNVNELPTEPFTVEVGYNTQEIRSALENLVENLNELSSFVEQNEAYLSPGVESLVESLLNNPMLENIGITNIDGRLELTQELEDLLENPRMVENLVQPTVESFVGSVQNTTSSISTLSSYQMIQTPFNYSNYNYVSPYSYVSAYSTNLLISYLLNSFMGYA